MSVRPREVADEAARFTLRSFFAGSDAKAGADDGGGGKSPPGMAHATAAHLSTAQQQPYSQPYSQHQQAVQQQQQQLRFDLAGAGSAGPPLLPLGTGSSGAATGLKFTLPSMRAPEAFGAQSGLRMSMGSGGGAIEKKLQAGYITGGFAKTNDPEIMRLNGVIDDLQSKLKKSSERIATAEQSVARGNAALQSERATSHARIVALASEVKNAQHREANVRAELASVPKLGDFDRTKFEMQARGAVELQNNYDEELKRARALQEVIDGMTGKQESLLSEHAALQTRLDDALAELSQARDVQALASVSAATTTAATEEQAEATRCPLEREEDFVPGPNAYTLPVAASVTVPCVPDAISVETHEAALGALQEALAEARMQIVQQEAIVTSERVRNAEADAIIKELDGKLVDAREATRTAQSQQASLEEFTMAMGIAPMSSTGQCKDRYYDVGEENDKPHEEKDDATETDPESKVAREILQKQGLKDEVVGKATSGRGQGNAGGWPSKHDGMPSGGGRSNNVTRAPGEAAVSERVVADFQRYFALKQTAEHAAAAVECAGDAATQPMIDAAMHAHACARRAYWHMINDEPEVPLVGCCIATAKDDVAEDDPEIDVLAIREGLATSMNANGFQMGVSCELHDDCGVDFHAVPVATGRVTMSHTAEAVGLKMRTDKYVSAVSGDIKAKLLHQRNAWITTQLGPQPVQTTG